MNNLILDEVKKLSKTSMLLGYKVGLAGSYARGEETDISDIDVVIDTDMLTLDQINFIHDYFKKDVDVIQLKLLKEEDKRLDDFAVSQGFPINDDSTYKSICREVIWFG